MRAQEGTGGVRPFSEADIETLGSTKDGYWRSGLKKRAIDGRRADLETESSLFVGDSSRSAARQQRESWHWYFRFVCATIGLGDEVSGVRKPPG